MRWKKAMIIATSIAIFSKMPPSRTARAPKPERKAFSKGRPQAEKNDGKTVKGERDILAPASPVLLYVKHFGKLELSHRKNAAVFPQ